MSATVRFLAGEGPDGRGRSHAQVLALDDAALERHHDYIQWLFPLEEPSLAVPGSPVLTRSDVEAIRTSPAAQANLAAAAARMLAFYEATGHWLRPSDHNHLRITRIVKSLRGLAGDAAADAFRARHRGAGRGCGRAGERHLAALLGRCIRTAAEAAHRPSAPGAASRSP